MTVRFYSSTAPEVTLSAGVNNVDTVIVVSSTLGFPLNTPYTLALDYGGAVEELVQVNSVAGTSLTVTRAIDGTSAAAHGPGAKVRHVTSARDFKDSRDHENANSSVHGVTGDVVGTGGSQILTNKTLTSPVINGATMTGNIFINEGVEIRDLPNAVPLLVRAAVGQSLDIVQIQDESGVNAVLVNSNGFMDVTKGAHITGGNDLGSHAVIIQQGPFPGGTGALSVRNQGGTELLGVYSTEITTGVPFNPSSTDVSGGTLVTAAAGWTIAGNMIATVKGGFITINGNVTRSGANITIDAAGAPSTGITAMCTIAASYRQKSTLGTMYFHGGNSIATGTLRMASSGGTIELVRWQANQTISTGNTISFTLTYPLS